jgi:hypothetical protein
VQAGFKIYKGGTPDLMPILRFLMKALGFVQHLELHQNIFWILDVSVIRYKRAKVPTHLAL